jgi:hypothetical protein
MPVNITRQAKHISYTFVGTISPYPTVEQVAVAQYIAVEYITELEESSMLAATIQLAFDYTLNSAAIIHRHPNT